MLPLRCDVRCMTLCELPGSELPVNSRFNDGCISSVFLVVQDCNDGGRGTRVAGAPMTNSNLASFALSPSSIKRVGKRTQFSAYSQTPISRICAWRKRSGHQRLRPKLCVFTSLTHPKGMDMLPVSRIPRVSFGAETLAARAFQSGN